MQALSRWRAAVARRTLFCLAVAGLVRGLIGSAAAAPAASAGRAGAERLNILFCFADDWGRYAGAYARIDGRPSINDVIRTPHFDRIAREGVLFRNAFVPAPSCTPCRSSILSGRYFFNTGRGAILNGAVWDESIASFPLLLKDAGYHIGKSYKVWSPGTPADAPFGAQRYAYQRAGGLANNYSEHVTQAVAKGATIEAARQEILAQVGANFDAFLADRQPGRPWLYWFGPTTVHRTWIKDSGRRLWGIDPEALRGKLPAFLPDVPEIRTDVADYLGEAQAFDAYVGVLLQRLEAAGELERTLVVVSGDHGMPGMPGGKCNLYDFGVGAALAVRMPGGRGGRVADDFVNLMDLAPTFLELGGVPIPASVDGRSLVPVLESTRSGQIDPRRRSVITGRERHVSTARAGNLPYPQRALRTREFLYIRNFAPERWPMGDPGPVTAAGAPEARLLETNTRAAFADLDASPTKAWLIGRRNEPAWAWHYAYAFEKRPAEELYDLRTDPDQTNNVATLPRYAARKSRLQRELLRRLERLNDPRVTGQGRLFESSPFTDP